MFFSPVLSFVVPLYILYDTSNWINLAIAELCGGQYINVFANFSPSFFARYGKTSSYCTIFFHLFKSSTYVFFRFIFLFLCFFFLLLIDRFFFFFFPYLSTVCRIFLHLMQKQLRLSATNLVEIVCRFSSRFRFAQRHSFYDSISETENAMIY